MTLNRILFFCIALSTVGCGTLADQMLSEADAPIVADTVVAPIEDTPVADIIVAATETPAISAAFTIAPNPTATNLLLPEDVLGETETPVQPDPAATEAPAPTATEPPVISAQIPAEGALTLNEIAAGFNRPIYATHFGDGSQRLLIVEQSGVIWVRQSDGEISGFLDISDRVTRSSNEQGLLGVAFAPDFANSRLFYVHYSDDDGDTTLSRFTADETLTIGLPDSEEILLTESQPYGNHNGGSIAFGADGMLYIGLGDGGRAGDPLDSGQDPGTLLGSILRIDVSGDSYTIPADNPFGNEVWAYGIRNPWRFSFDRANGDLYIGDVGQNQYEEISYLAADFSGDRNLGWRPVEGFHCYEAGCDLSLYLPPIAEYDHSLGCSVTGGYVYRGAQYPSLNGVYFYGDYCTGNIWGLTQQADGTWQNALVSRSGLTISSFAEDEAGELYVVDHQGQLYQIALNQ